MKLIRYIEKSPCLRRRSIYVLVMTYVLVIFQRFQIAQNTRKCCKKRMKGYWALFGNRSWYFSMIRKYLPKIIELFRGKSCPLRTKKKLFLQL